MSDAWIQVEGEIVGWLERIDGEVAEHDLAVVKVTRYKFENSLCWTEECNHFPGFVLRWLGNDTTVIRHGTVAREAEEINLGDHISFSTNDTEQDGYALWN